MRIKINKPKLLLTVTSLTCPLLAHAQQENMDTFFDVPHLLAYTVAALLIGFFCLIFYNRLIVYREQDNRIRSNTQNTQLAMIMRNRQLQAWIFNIDARTYNLLSTDGSVEHIYTPIDFLHFYDRDDFDKLRQQISSISHGLADYATLRVRGYVREQTKGSKMRFLEENLRLFERDADGHPLSIICLERDITNEMEQHEHVDKLTMRFQTVFNSSAIDMIYYDKDGNLTDINEKACHTFGVKNREALLRRGLNIKDISPFKDINIHTLASYEMSTIADIDAIRSAGQGMVPEVTVNGKLFYDIVINPIRNEKGELTGLYTAGRDITEMVDTYHRQKESTRQLERATKDIQDYVNNINYSLQTSQVRLINYHPDSHELEVSSDLSHTQYELTQVRCVELVSEEHRRRAKGLLRRMDRRENTPLEVTLKTILRDEKGRKVWLTFSVIPMLSKDGTVSHYFGMCSNSTELVATQQLLQEETAKAQETERLKDAFLLNMSYEIRTPLNTVLGFAQMFNQEHDSADEPFFAEEIKRNANELLALVNESLYLSRLDAHMIEMHKTESDFSIIFDSYCYAGFCNAKEGVQAITENPYQRLMVNIDEQHVGEVIQRICANAVFNTTEGFVRSKYMYRKEALIIAVEDTGKGIDAQTLPHVFDRFVTDSEGRSCGDGLNLPIAKELTEQMGGKLDVQSDAGKGTTIWITIPCEATIIEKKVLQA